MQFISYSPPVAISDSGTTVLDNVEGINFDDSLAVTIDGDDTITVDAASASVTSINPAQAASGEEPTASGTDAIVVSPGGSASAAGSYSTLIGQSITDNGNAGCAGVGAGVTFSGVNSVALGNAASAAGNSVVLGATASAQSNAVAIGDSAEASNDNATGIGERTVASGGGSTAVGEDTEASGDSSTSVGQSATASDPQATAVGQSTTASGSRSTAVGERASATGVDGTGIGRTTTADSNSTAIGADATATGSSTALGTNTTADGIGAIALGLSADTRGENRLTAFVNQSEVFRVEENGEAKTGPDKDNLENVSTQTVTRRYSMNGGN